MQPASVRTLSRIIRCTKHRSRSSRTFHSAAPSAAMTRFSVSSPVHPSPSPSDAQEKSHHRKEGMGFQNPWPSYEERQISQFMKWIIIGGITGSRKKVDLTPPTVTVHTPKFLPSRDTDKLRATWLGHASYFVEFPGGLRVLFDPVFTPRCSPFSFMGPKRYTEAPCQVSDLPAALDVVVLSHNHYDHLSFPTIQAVIERFPALRFFVPMGVKAWFEASFGATVAKNVIELDWWEERDITMSDSASSMADGGHEEETELDAGRTGEPAEIKATFSCLPAQHMTARGPFDRYKTLWASWAVTSGGKKLWFAGDTGYRSIPEAISNSEDDYAPEHAALPTCPAFKQIGELHGPFDLGLIPIGAYAPRFLMSPVHANPYDAVNIFVDTKCERALAMHWGTWVLTEEPVLEPPQLLKRALKWKGINEEGLFDACEIGESREF